MAFLISVIGIKDIDRYTMKDLDVLYNTYLDNKLNEYKTLEKIIYSSVAQAMGGNDFKSIFDSKRTTSKNITEEERKEIADRLLKKWGGEL